MHRKDLSLLELDALITAHNNNVDLYNQKNTNAFFAQTPIKTPTYTPTFSDIDDITLPEFQEYIQNFLERSKESKNPVMRAIANGEPFETIQEMINRHKYSSNSPEYYKIVKNIQYEDKDNNTHLHLAVLVNKDVQYICQLIKILRDAPLSMQHSNKYGMQPYHMAIASGREEMLKASPYLATALKDTTWEKNKWENNTKNKYSFDLT